MWRRPSRAAEPTTTTAQGKRPRSQTEKNSRKRKRTSTDSPVAEQVCIGMVDRFDLFTLASGNVEEAEKRQPGEESGACTNQSLSRHRYMHTAQLYTYCKVTPRGERSMPMAHCPVPGLLFTADDSTLSSRHPEPWTGTSGRFPASRACTYNVPRISQGRVRFEWRRTVTRSRQSRTELDGPRWTWDPMDNNRPASRKRNGFVHPHTGTQHNPGRRMNPGSGHFPSIGGLGNARRARCTNQCRVLSGRWMMKGLGSPRRRESLRGVLGETGRRTRTGGSRGNRIPRAIPIN